MTKEIEFLEKQGYMFDKDKDLLFMEEFFSSEHKIKDVCDLLRKYADQQTSELKAEVEKRIKQVYEERLENSRLTSELSERLSELNELKERHKKDANVCQHNFIQVDVYWKSCTHCGAKIPMQY